MIWNNEWIIDIPIITKIELPGSFNALRGYTVLQSPGFEDFFALVPTVIPTPSPSPTTQPPTSDPTDNQNIAITIIRTTKSYASEESFKIMDGNTIVYTQPSISNYSNYTWSISLCRKNYILVMTDSWDDGWSSGSSVEFKIGDTSIGSYRLSSGSSTEVSLRIDPYSLNITTRWPGFWIFRFCTQNFDKPCLYCNGFWEFFYFFLYIFYYIL